jgi:hypothetical protein
MYIAFSKIMGTKGRLLAEQFSNTLKQLKKEGLTEQIVRKYFQ